MRYRTLPHTTLHASVLCLGTADMGTKISREESFRLLDAFAAAGGNFIDTAAVYSDWVPGERSRVEKLLGEWLRTRGRRDRIILATKGVHPPLGAMHASRMTRRDILHDLHASLKHLNTDAIDLYWLHRDAPDHPVGEILETLDEQVRAGTIRYFGCSNWRSERIAAALEYARAHGLRGFVANQPLWNLAHVPHSRLPDPTCAVMDAAMFEVHCRTNLACVPWSAQANGYFHHRANGTLDHMSEAHRRMYGDPINDERFARAAQLVRETGMSMTDVVLAYLLAQPFPVFPIIGCRSVAQLHDSLRASDRADQAWMWEWARPL